MIGRRFNTVFALCLSAGISAQVLGAPTSQPALPAGHPAISQPDNATTGLPAGHPAIPQQNNGANLPAGHPNIAGAPKTVAHGSISLHATQGSAKGGSPAGDVVSIDLYSSAPAPTHYEGRLDKTGTFSLPDVTINGACQPVIKIVHGGINYQGIGEVMDPAHSIEKVEVKVFDTTEQAPQWSIKMRHVVLRRTPVGLEVTEMLMLDNPADHVWLGTGDAKKGRVTLDLPLPAGAQNVELGNGLKDGNGSAIEGHVIKSAPLMPGQSELQFRYILPVDAGKAHLSIAAPAAIGHLMIFAPNDGSTVTGEGLIDAGSGDTPAGNVRFFMVPSVPAGKVTKIDFAKLAAPTTKASADDAGKTPTASSAVGTETQAVADGSQPVRKSSRGTVVGVGSAALLVVGSIAIFARPNSAKRG